MAFKLRFCFFSIFIIAVFWVININLRYVYAEESELIDGNYGSLNASVENIGYLMKGDKGNNENTNESSTGKNVLGETKDAESNKSSESNASNSNTTEDFEESNKVENKTDSEESEVYDKNSEIEKTTSDDSESKNVDERDKAKGNSNETENIKDLEDENKDVNREDNEGEYTKDENKMGVDNNSKIETENEENKDDHSNDIIEIDKSIENKKDKEESSKPIIELDGKDGDNELGTKTNKENEEGKPIELGNEDNYKYVHEAEDKGESNSELAQESVSESEFEKNKTSDYKQNEVKSIEGEYDDKLTDNREESLKDEEETNQLNDIKSVVDEMKEELASKSSNKTILERIENNYVITIKKLDYGESLGEKDAELETKTKESEVKLLKKDKPEHENNINQDIEKEDDKHDIEDTDSQTKPESKKYDISDINESKTNKELIDRLKSLSTEADSINNKEESINEEDKKDDEKMEALIQEKKDYDKRKREKKNKPLQKKRKWYERRDPVTGELLFDAAALSRNITAAITAKRKKGSFSMCFQFNGEKEKCETTKNCFYDDVYDMCLLDCSLLNKKDACEEYLECRFDYVVPRKACVNDCFQSRNFTKQELNGVMRGCMWCSQEIMCNTLKKIQERKFPDPNNREFDCNWQIQNGLDSNDEYTENSICVDRNLGRTITDKDLVAANYISAQTKLTKEAAEKIKQKILTDGESEEVAELQIQNIDILKKKICYPPNIPFSILVPEKKYYIGEEEVIIECQLGYKITGASNKLKCTNGEFSPKVFCIAYNEIKKQRESIGRHFNNIFNLLVNSVFGGGGWIDFGIEKIIENRNNKSNDEYMNISNDENLKSNDTENQSLIVKEAAEMEIGNATKPETMSDKEVDSKEKTGESDESHDEEVIVAEGKKKSEEEAKKVNILIDRVTGDTIFSTKEN